MKKLLKRAAWLSLVLLVSGSAFIAFCWYRVEWSSQPYCYNEVSGIPHNKVGIVLGTSKYNRYGRTNLYFKNRIEAAVALYKAGKIDYILVSGDNHISYYDEPEDMKKALIQRGVPADHIVCDYAGFRTFDSMVRLKEVFKQNSATVVSQEFHNKRALYIARQKKIDAVAFNAKDVHTASVYFGYFREILARVMAIIDVHILGTQPKFLGDPVYIG